MRNSPLKAFANSQGLSPTALKAKRERDQNAAMTPLRKKRKRENQAHPDGQSSNYDLHHKPDGSIVKTSTSNNRNVWKHGERT